MPSTPSRAPASAWRSVEVAGGQVDQVEQRGQLARRRRSPRTARAARRRRRDGRLDRRRRRPPVGLDPPLQLVVHARRSRAARRWRTAPSPRPAACRRGWPCSTAPSRRARRRTAASMSPACSTSERGGGAQRGALRPVGDRGEPARAARPSTGWSASQPRVMPQQPATSRMAAASRRRRQRRARPPDRQRRLDQHLRARATGRRAAPGARSRLRQPDVGQRGQRGGLGPHQPAGQRPGAELGEAERVARPARCSCSTGLRLARAGPMWTLTARSRAERLAQVAVDACRARRRYTRTRSRSSTPRRAGAQRGDDRVPLEPGHPGLRLGVPAHRGGGDPAGPGRHQQARAGGRPGTTRYSATGAPAAVGRGTAPGRAASSTSRRYWRAQLRVARGQLRRAPS